MDTKRVRTTHSVFNRTVGYTSQSSGQRGRTREKEKRVEVSRSKSVGATLLIKHKKKFKPLKDSHTGTPRPRSGVGQTEQARSLSFDWSLFKKQEQEIQQEKLKIYAEECVNSVIGRNYDKVEFYLTQISKEKVVDLVTPIWCFEELIQGKEIERVQNILVQWRESTDKVALLESVVRALVYEGQMVGAVDVIKRCYKGSARTQALSELAIEFNKIAKELPQVITTYSKHIQDLESMKVTSVLLKSFVVNDLTKVACRLERCEELAHQVKLGLDALASLI